MKYIYIFFTLCFISCNSDSDTKKDSLWVERNTFLEHPIFHNKAYQENEFSKYKGLWTCVREERNKENKVTTPKYLDLLFANGKAWMIDYPCSWNMQGYAEDVHFRNDSIFFSTADRVYIEKKQVEFRKDTLVIFGTNNYDESNYYLRKPFESIILAELKKKQFNEECFLGKWELTQIGNGYSDTWVIQDGFLDHVPRELDFSSQKFNINRIYLTSAANQNIKFEILQFDRSYSEHYGEESMLWIKEIKEIDGIEYHYMFEPIKK
jgi:hypothetical protein